MRNLIALQRIKSQTVRPQPSLETVIDAIQQVTLSPPLSVDELRELLIAEIYTSVSATPTPEAMCNELLEFPHIYVFVDWYSGKESQFSDTQRQALDTLVLARQTIDNGCRCRREQRERVAHGYFTTFWVNNATTDLLPAIAKIGNVNQVIITQVASWPTPMQPS